LDRATRHHLTTLATRLEHDLAVAESMMGAIPGIVCSPERATSHMVKYGSEAMAISRQLEAVRLVLAG
jgi:hypothetical protein